MAVRDTVWKGMQKAFGAVTGAGKTKAAMTKHQTYVIMVLGLVIALIVGVLTGFFEIFLLLVISISFWGVHKTGLHKRKPWIEGVFLGLIGLLLFRLPVVGLWLTIILGLIGLGLVIRVLVFKKKRSFLTYYFRKLAEKLHPYITFLNMFVLLIGIIIILALWMFVTKDPFAITLFLLLLAFLYATAKRPAFGVMVLIPLLIFAWIIASGWAALIIAWTAPIIAPISVSMEPIYEQIGAFIADMGLMITNPTAWYEKQFVSAGKREEEATAEALEITSIEALPNSMMPGDRFNVVFDIQNKGKEPAVITDIGVQLGQDAIDAGSVIMLPGGGVAQAAEQSVIQRQILKDEKLFESFTLKSPDCSGSFKVTGSLGYKYAVRGTTNLQLISRVYYQELLEAGKMEWVGQLSTSSAGPFKLTLRTDRQQPIPVQEVGTTTATVFTLYFGIVNEREGDAALNEVNISIPAALTQIRRAANRAGYSKTKKHQRGQTRSII